MQDPVSELRRIPILGTSVNKGMKKGRTCQTLLLLLVAGSLLPLAQPLGGDSLLLILDAYASVLRPTLFAAERSLTDNRSAAMSLLYYS
jgi:hypothetical protein